ADHAVAAQVHRVDQPGHSGETERGRRAKPGLFDVAPPMSTTTMTIQFTTMTEPRLPEPDRPWVMRTYSGHSTARESNELYRKNLEKGQTGLSVAFDLPTQTGYDPDHELSRGEVGKVGVSIAHKGDMHTLLDGIPLD